jgi:hypothetical protein
MPSMCRRDSPLTMNIRCPLEVAHHRMIPQAHGPLHGPLCGIMIGKAEKTNCRDTRIGSRCYLRAVYGGPNMTRSVV